jgi:hypothetical protein
MTYRHAFCAAGLVAVAACSDSGSGPTSDPQVTLSLATHPVAAPAAKGVSLSAATAPETYTDGAGNTLVLTRVQLVIREIEMENEAAENACDLPTSGDDDCAEIEVGPMLADLPLGSAGASRTLSTVVPAGTYDKVQFEIHKPESSDDAAFIAANPGFDGVSIRAEGTYNGTPFGYTSALDVEMEFALNPPLVVAENGAADLTLLVDLGTWVRTLDGALVDPQSANKGGPNEGLVNENVKRSLETFEDEDHDGSDDHGGLDGAVATL